MSQVTITTVSNGSENGGQQQGFLADNGNVWFISEDFGNSRINAFYSTNKGTSWTQDNGGTWAGSSLPQSASIYNIGDKVWMIVDGIQVPYTLIFVWGTLNAARTAITWDSYSLQWLDYNDYVNVTGLVVHAEGSGYTAHFTTSHRYWNSHRYWRATLNSGGALVSMDVSAEWTSGGSEGSSYGQIWLDPATKDVHLVAIASSGGNSYDLRYSKRAYTSGTWPAGTNRTIYSGTSYSDRVASAFDGDRTVMAVLDDSNTDTPLVFERDKADTTTTTRTPGSGVSGGVNVSTNFDLQTNALKDILLVFNDPVHDATDFYKNTFTRGAGTWGGASLVIDTTPNTDAFGFKFIPGTKYFFFRGSTTSRTDYFLTDFLEVAYTGAATLQGVATMAGTATFTLSGGTIIPRPIIEVAFTTNPTSETPSWTDISDYVVTFNVRRGRQQELDVFEPGTASFTLDNDDRRFDPNNASSPYYPNVLPVRRIRIRAYWAGQLYDVYNGYVNGWPQSYPGKHRILVDVAAVDALGFLQLVDLTETRPQESSGARVTALLNDSNWPATQRSIDTGQETLAAVTERTGSALSLAQEVSLTELGRLFASKDGKVTFQGRDKSMQNLPASEGTWSDGTVEWTVGHAINYDGSGSVVFNGDGTITVSDGGGGDFFGTADTGTILWRDMDVPGEVEVKITSNLNTTETNLRFLGIRSSTAANASMFMLLTDGDNSHFSTVWRDTDGATAGYQGENNGPAYNNTLPVWAKITFDGTTARAYISQDDRVTYTLINSRAIPGLDVAYLANGGGAGTHVSTVYAPVSVTPVSLYDDIVPSYDEEKIYNRVNETRDGGTLQTAQDTVSQGQYFIRDLSESGLPLTDDPTALARAQFLLSQYKDPKLRFTSMDVNPRTDDTYAVNLALELGDHIVAERFTSSQITQDVMVDGIQINADRDTKMWNYTFYLTAVPVTANYWIVGTSRLGINTVLGF